MISNKGFGNQFEREFCMKLAKFGFWVHNISQTVTGQPADVIAVRHGLAELIDCKVCMGKRKVFSTDRIEDNQYYSMKLWQECGNGNGWFAVKFDENIYMVTLDALEKAGQVTLSEDWFKTNASSLEDWATP